MREARKKKQLTLSELARRIGVTIDYLSNLEHHRQEPSLPVLRELAEALDIPTTMLFAEEPTDEVIVLRRHERTAVRFLNLPGECELVTPLAWRSAQPPEIEVLQQTVPPHERISMEDLSTHTDECIYVLAGELEYRYGTDSVRIHAGGSIFIPRKTGHHLFNPGETATVILWIVKSTLGGGRA
ncbi:XRE family transcriptional regulator [Paenibacillus cisolokensis]|uniref:helix-turn-helix domain-containing protein n=1 Tax=Paenibacillus cisolokensis TaxID=1658519 RepID=UPI003D2AB270